MFKIILLTCINFAFLSCAVENKLEKSIQQIDQTTYFSSLTLEEGEEKNMLPLINDTLIDYIVNQQKFNNIQYLTIRNCPNLTAEGYRKLAALTQVSELHFENTTISNLSVNGLIENRDSLENLTIRNCYVDTIIISNTKKLKSIDIYDSPEIKSVIANNNKKTISLMFFDGGLNNEGLDFKFEQNSKITLFFSDKIIPEKFNIISDTSQYALIFNSCQFTSPISKALKSCENLQDLRLYELELTNLELSDFPNLKQLFVNQTEESSTSDINALE